MALKTIVKINSVSNLSDARYCAGMGVDMLGYAMYHGAEAILDANSYREINDWVSGVKTVGEFELESIFRIREIVGQYGFQVIETARPELLSELRTLDRPIILKMYIDGISRENLVSTLQYASGMVEYFLLDSKEHMQTAQITAALREFAGKFPILLAAGIQADNLEALIEPMRLAGIAVSGSQEIRPGYKDYEALADILEALEADE